MPVSEKLTQATEDYLKAIYDLNGKDWAVTTNALAQRLGYAPASVTGMLKKLAVHEPKLVHYTRHRGVTLTEAGEKISLEIIRHHRLIELYLSDALGYSWDKVHEEAEMLEHVISEEFEERISRKLGDPDLDPHGEPIPTKEGSVATPSGACLTDLESGQAGIIVRVLDDNPSLLRYLAELGMQPSAHVRVTERAPFGGPLYVRVRSGDVHALGRQVTDSIYLSLDKI